MAWNVGSRSPYGMEKGYNGLDDLIAHLSRRKKLEIKIIEDVMKEKAKILQAKRYDIEQLLKCIIP